METICGRTPSLRELQQWMAALIVSGEPLAALLRNGGACEALIARNRGNIAERLAVYVNGYPARLQEALAEQFPAIAHVVGAGAFGELVHRYLEAVPLRSYNLNDAGAALPQFLSDDGLTKRLPFLTDLAQLEWAVARAFHAWDEPLFDPTSVAHWTPEQWEHAVLRFQPWVAVVTSNWPIREIWECRDTPLEEIAIDLCNRPDRVRVRRLGLAIMCESLDEPEAIALGALLAGRTLGAALTAINGDDPETVAAWFARWAAAGMITAYDL